MIRPLQSLLAERRALVLERSRERDPIAIGLPDYYLLAIDLRISSHQENAR